jgi:hypothetical protein
MAITQLQHVADFWTVRNGVLIVYLPTTWPSKLGSLPTQATVL